MQKRYTTPFREFIKRDEKGRYHVRLGPQTFSTDLNFSDIRIESEHGGTPVQPEMMLEKPWIMKNLEQEIRFQRKKQLAQVLECTHIPSPERRAYKHARGFVGAR